NEVVALRLRLVDLPPGGDPGLGPEASERPQLGSRESVSDPPPAAVAQAPERPTRRTQPQGVWGSVSRAERRRVRAEDRPRQPRRLGGEHRAMAVDVND